MHNKIVIVFVIWLIPVGAALVAAPEERALAAIACSIYSFVMSVWVARLPMLRCPSCHSRLSYLAGFASLLSPGRRYVVCPRCCCVVDRLRCRPMGFVTVEVLHAQRRLSAASSWFNVGLLLLIADATFVGLLCSYGNHHPLVARNFLSACVGAGVVAVFSIGSLCFGVWYWRYALRLFPQRPCRSASKLEVQLTANRSGD